MSDKDTRRFCPYSFNTPADQHLIKCLEDQCMAWVPAKILDDGVEMGGDGEPYIMKVTVPGYCKLIERGS